MTISPSKAPGRLNRNMQLDDKNDMNTRKGVVS